MPLTFPSHAAAILPLLHLPGTRRLPAAALVVGSTAPDLIYLSGTRGAAAHLPWGLLQFCLPAGLLAFLYLESLLLPVLGPLLLPLLPERWQPRFTRLVTQRPLPNTLTRWLAVGLAILLGAATHQLWDSFTHAWMWPAHVLYPGVTISLLGHAVLVSKVLQHLSSILGAIIVLLYVTRVLQPGPATELATRNQGEAVRRLVCLVLVPLLGGVVAGAVRLRHPHPLFTRALWDAAWAAVACFWLLLGAACLLVRARQSVEQGAGAGRGV